MQSGLCAFQAAFWHVAAVNKDSVQAYVSDPPTNAWYAQDTHRTHAHTHTAIKPKRKIAPPQ